MADKCTKCGKPAIEGATLCFKCGGRAPVKSKLFNFVLYPPGGGTDVNTDFASRAKEPLYDKAIQNILGKGSTAVSRAYSVKKIQLNHDTIGAGTGNHASIFYTWNGRESSTMYVMALGYHPGDNMKKYELMWYDGTSFAWTRPG